MSQDKSKESAVELLDLIQEQQATKSPALAAKQARLLALLKTKSEVELSLFEQFAAQRVAETGAGTGADQAPLVPPVMPLTWYSQ